MSGMIILKTFPALTNPDATYTVKNTRMMTALTVRSWFLLSWKRFSKNSESVREFLAFSE